MARYSSDAAKNCQRREVDIGTFALPCCDESVYFVAMVLKMRARRIVAMVVVFLHAGKAIRE
jgi:hypothetical protein